MGNPGDVVEVRADLVVSAASKKVKYSLQERVDWWLEEADDEYALFLDLHIIASADPPSASVFVLRTDCELPDEFVSFGRLLLLSKDEWAKTAKKSKLPKPRVDKDLLTIAIEVLENRLKEYSTTIDVKLDLLYTLSRTLIHPLSG